MAKVKSISGRGEERMTCALHGTTCFFSLLCYERLLCLFQNNYMLNFKTCSFLCIFSLSIV